MSDKKAFPPTAAPTAPTAGGFVPAPPPHAVASAAAAAAAACGGGGNPYAVYQQLYPGQVPPGLGYDPQAIMAAAAGHQMYPATAATIYANQAAAAASYYPSAFTPVQAYYPLATAYSYPQPNIRPTIMIPNAYDGGARFDGVSAPVIPGPPPGVPPTPAQIAALAGHSITLTQKKGGFLTGASDGGYAFW